MIMKSYLDKYNRYFYMWGLVVLEVWLPTTLSPL